MEELDHIFKPRSVAVIGASNQASNWGFWTVHNMVSTGFRGPIYPVHPRDKQVCGVPAYARLEDIPGEVEMAIIVVPARYTPQVMEECARKGVKGAVVISGGFAEIGAEGKALQDRMLAIARSAGIRFVGPNGVGIYSSAARLSLCFPKAPIPGPIAFISHSGTFGGYLVETANARGYGISKFISIGNQADLTASDYLLYLASDPDTKVIVLYMEGFVDGHAFFEAARQVVRQKPLIIHKGGFTSPGARAAMSHTASLAGEERIFDAMCHQVGIIRASEALHSFDMAHALASQPLPKGNRVAIIGSGGQGVVTADACAALGLEVPELDVQSAAMLKSYLFPHAPMPKNPVDFAGGGRSPAQEAELIERVASLDYIDGIITNIPTAWLWSATPLELARADAEGAEILASIPRKHGKPIVCLRWLGAESKGIVGMIQSVGIPAFDTPNDCARAMSALVKYAQVRRSLELAGS